MSRLWLVPCLSAALLAGCHGTAQERLDNAVRAYEVAESALAIAEGTLADAQASLDQAIADLQAARNGDDEGEITRLELLLLDLQDARTQANDRVTTLREAVAASADRVSQIDVADGDELAASLEIAGETAGAIGAVSTGMGFAPGGLIGGLASSILIGIAERRRRRSKSSD